ncbi:MAG: hypothetical protein ABJE10_19025 [bacterium]
MIRFRTLAAISASLTAITTVAVTTPRIGLTTGLPQQLQSVAQTGQPIAGISCDLMEGQRMHIHQHLVILDKGIPVAIPQNVGQVPQQRCLYWVHTHTPDGIIHIEAPKDRTFTLGDFFQIWGQPLSRTQAASAQAKKGASLKVWVDGKPYTGNPNTIALSKHADIVIEAGPPFPKPPKFTTWGSL